MNKFFYGFVALIATGLMSVQARGVEIGVKGGLSIPNLTSGGLDTPLSEGYSSFMAFGGGVFADFKFTKLFSLQVGVDYNQQGGQKDGVQALPANEIYAGITAVNPQFASLQPFLPAEFLYADLKSVAHFNYLMLPVQAKFGWDFSENSPFRVYVSAGIFGSYLLSSDNIQKGTFPPFYLNEAKGSLRTFVENNPIFQGAMSMIPDPVEQEQTRMGILMGVDAFANAQQPVDNKKDIIDEVRRVNFGFIGAVGLTYQLHTKGKLLIEAGGNYGLVKLQKDTKNGQNRIGAGSVVLGYAYAL